MWQASWQGPSQRSIMRAASAGLVNSSLIFLHNQASVSMTASARLTGPATTTTAGHPARTPAARTPSARPGTTAPSAPVPRASSATRWPPAGPPGAARPTWWDSRGSEETSTRISSSSQIIKKQKGNRVHFFRYPFLNITDSECFSASLNTFLHRNNSIRNNPEQGKRKRIRNSALKKWVQLVQHSNSSAIKHPK